MGFVRPAQLSDLSVLEGIFAIPELTFYDGSHYTKEFMKHYIDENYFLVYADEKNKVQAGLISESIKGNGVVVRSIGVNGVSRGKGIGTQLMLQLEENALKQGKSRLFLYGSLESEEALSFYKSLGFSQGNVPGVEMVKPLK